MSGRDFSDRISGRTCVSSEGDFWERNLRGATLRAGGGGGGQPGLAGHTSGALRGELRHGSH